MKRTIVHSAFSIIYILLALMGNFHKAECQKIDPTIYKGRTVIEDVYCPGLENNLLGSPANQPVKVYLPPGYENFPSNKYPVVYLLHPYWSDYNFYYISSPGLFELLNQMISEKLIMPMIVVTPNASNKYYGSYYTNSYVTGKWEDYIVRDVIHWIDNKYRVLDQKKSRGLAGFEMGGYGTIKIGMQYPSLFNSIGFGDASLDFREWCIDGLSRKDFIDAAGINQFRPGDSKEVHLCMAQAVAFAPDSTNKPLLGRLPFTKDGIFIDSIWQKWLLHDPVTMLETYTDSLRKLDTIQLYSIEGDDPRSQSFECFHKELMDHGIKHGYEVYSGNVLNRLFGFFSDNLAGIVPTVILPGEYYHESTDHLEVTSSLDGKIYIVPSSKSQAVDSIYNYPVVAVDAFAEEPMEIELSDFEHIKYRVFAVSHDSAISNIPGEFQVVPDKSPPMLSLNKDTMVRGESIKVTSNRDATICLHTAPFLNLDTLKTASGIMNSPRLIESVDALAHEDVSFSTAGLGTRSYWIYGFDKYGLVSDPLTVVVKDLTSSSTGKEHILPVVEFFPNPVNEILYVYASIPGTYDISITGLSGKLLFNESIVGTTLHIDLSTLQSGVYIITVRSKSFLKIRKIIKY